MSAIRPGTVRQGMVRGFMRIGPRFLPFADAATRELPLGRLLRLSLFQVTVGMAVALLNGVLNRVMIVELAVSATLVGLMVSLPVLFAPLRALVGHKSDTYRSVLGWRRVPFLWFGTMLQFGGFAIMPFSLLILSGDTHGPVAIGQVAAALAFLLVGVGLHTTQTAGLALATDLATDETRPRVVCLMYVMFLAGLIGSALAFGWLLRDFTAIKLIQVVQGAAVVTVALNIVALWKQEARNPEATRADRARPAFAASWGAFMAGGRSRRLLVAVGLGTAAFSMQDILLEPYGAEVLKLSVASTTALTAIFAAGALVSFALAARVLARGFEPHRLAALGLIAGIFAFSGVIFAAPLESPNLFRAGTALIGFGGGLFAVGTLSAAMGLARDGRSGIAIGAWGGVQATAAGLAIATGSVLRDLVAHFGAQGTLGAALSDPSSAYGVVYHVEIALIFMTLIAIGPLVRAADPNRDAASSRFGLVHMPG